MKPEISEEIISGWRREFHSWWSLRSIGMAKDNNYPMMEIAYIAAKTSSHERILELERELNDSMNFHCPHFLTNDSGTVSCHSGFVNKLTKRDELLKEAINIAEDADVTSGTIYQLNSWLKKVKEQLEQEK